MPLVFSLFMSAAVRIPFHTASKCGTEPIRYKKKMMLHFRDRRGAAQRSFVTEITLLVCEKAHPG